MLNNKATQAKLESANYLAIQTKQCDQQGYSNQISHAKGANSILHKQEGN